VAGADTISLVSEDSCGAGSVVAEEFATASLLACQDSSLFYVYDSLIEKCSTLSVRASARVWGAFFSPKLSVGME
jgi:hypothetical protein